MKKDAIPTPTSSESMTFPIAAARITPPPLADHTIFRQHLCVDPSSAAEILCCAITAPAGYGKTTAAVQLAAAADPNFCWLSLESADNDPERFFRYVGGALRLEPDKVAAIAEALGRSGLPTASDMLRIELEQSAATVLVLDDLHELTNPVLLDVVADWLTLPDPDFTLICVSRAEPGLPLDRVRARAQIHEVGIDDLAFRPEEVSELYNKVNAVGPSPDDIELLLQTTRGWPTGVYFGALPRDTAPQLGEQFLADVGSYLQREVVDHLEADVHQFMVDTSVIPVLNAELCNRLTNRDDSLGMLEGLAAAYLVRIEVGGGDQPEFSYAPLLRQYLQQNLRSGNGSRHLELCSSAANWFASRLDVASALDCARLSRDVDLGKSIVYRSWRSMSRDGSYQAVREWAEAVGPDATDDAVVCMILAWGAGTSGDPIELRRWITRAETFDGGTAPVTVQICKPLILAYSHDRAGEIAAMRDQADSALQLIDSLSGEDDATAVLDALRGLALALVGLAALLQDDVVRAKPMLSAAVDFSRRPHHEHTLVYSLNQLAILHAMSGDHEMAVIFAEEAIDRANRSEGAVPLPAMAYLAMSIVQLGTNDYEASEGSLQAARQAIDEGHPVQRGLVHVQASRLLQRQGQPAEARKVLADARAIARTSPDTILDRQIRNVENQLRFVDQQPGDELPIGASELTEREIEILQLLPGPDSRAAVAKQLHISENTVKTHLTSISRKLGVRGRAGIVDRATELMLVPAQWRSSAVDQPSTDH